LRGQQSLELRLDSRIEILEPLPPVADHRRAKGPERFFAHFHGPGYVQFHVCHKLIITSKKNQGADGSTTGPARQGRKSGKRKAESGKGMGNGVADSQLPHWQTK